MVSEIGLGPGHLQTLPGEPRIGGAVDAPIGEGVEDAGLRRVCRQSRREGTPVFGQPFFHLPPWLVSRLAVDGRLGIEWVVRRTRASRCRDQDRVGVARVHRLPHR